MNTAGLISGRMDEDEDEDLWAGRRASFSSVKAYL
jgi:hypothetical protein